MFRLFLLVMCILSISVSAANALTMSFVLDQSQPGLLAAYPSLADNPTLDFDFDASGTNSASFSIHGYSSTFATEEVGYYATHTRYGSQSYSGMKVTFSNPISPSIPDDGLPFLANIYRITFLIIGDYDNGGPSASNTTNQDIIDWIGRQTNPLRLAMDIRHTYGTLYGDFKPALSSQIGGPDITPVPLPAGAPLLLGALGVLAFVRRRAGLTA